MKVERLFFIVFCIVSAIPLVGCFDPNLRELHLTSRTECTFRVNGDDSIGHVNDSIDQVNDSIGQEITIYRPSYYTSLPGLLLKNGLPGSAVKSMIPISALLFNNKYATDTVDVSFLEGIDVFFYDAADTIRIASVNVVPETSTVNAKLGVQEVDITGLMKPGDASNPNSGFKIVYILRAKPKKTVTLYVQVLYDAVGSL